MGLKIKQDRHVQKAIPAIEVGGLVLHDKYGIGSFLGLIRRLQVRISPFWITRIEIF